MLQKPTGCQLRPLTARLLFQARKYLCSWWEWQKQELHLSNVPITTVNPTLHTRQRRKQTKLPTRGPSHEEVDYRTCHSKHLFILSAKKRPGAAVSLENKVFIKKLDIEHPYSLCEKGPSHFPLAQDDSYGKIRMLKDGGISLTENEVMIYNN